MSISDLLSSDAIAESNGGRTHQEESESRHVSHRWRRQWRLYDQRYLYSFIIIINYCVLSADIIKRNESEF